MEESRRADVRRDLASRVEEQSERIAALSREMEELRAGLLKREQDLAESREEQNRLKRQIDRLTQAKSDADAQVERQQTTIAEVKNDARRLAEEVVRLQGELKSSQDAVSALQASGVAATARDVQGGQALPVSALQEVL